MNLHQRSEESGPTISGRKLSNYFTCTVKQVRKLSPQLNQQLARQKTFQTDSFKQILTKRSGCPSNKENISVQNKALKKIKQEPQNYLKSQQNTKRLRSNDKKNQKKSSTVSLTKVFNRNKSSNDIRKKQAKSVSPSKDTKDYRSGPVQKKNYLSNNTIPKNKQLVFSKSQKNLTDRVKNPKYTGKKQQKKQLKADKKQGIKSKKVLNPSKISINKKKPSHNNSKTQALAKQFDSLLKADSSKIKKTKKKKQHHSISKSKSKDKNIKNKSKQKKIIISQNNSKNFASKNKLNSYFSDESLQSPEKGILSTRYEVNKAKEKNEKQKRLSFEPNRLKGKKQQKAKTEALSPEKDLSNKNQAAIAIQRVFRGYLTRKYINQFKRILTSVIFIQKMWRGYRARKQFKSLKQQNLNKKKCLKLQNFHYSLQISRKDNTNARQNQLANLLEQILNQQNLNENIKSKISDFLKKQQKVASGRSHSLQSYAQQQVRSQRKFFQEADKRKNRFGSPTIKFSPNLKLQHSQFHKSPELMIQNLLAIKQFQRQKIINNAKLQIEGIHSLGLKNVFSPRTRDAKMNQVQKKLRIQLEKFDQSMGEVIKTCKQTDDINGQIKPFQSPSKSDRVIQYQQHEDQFGNLPQNSPHMRMQQIQLGQKQQKLNSSQRKLQDLSMELLEYYEQKTQTKHERQYQKIDCSYQFIEEYLLGLFQFLRQLGHKYRQTFINVMRTCRNLQVSYFLKNLNILTEDSDQDISFKLPMYKFLQREEVEVLSPDVVELFNSKNIKLQRNQLGMKQNLEDVYLKMIIDAVNQALNIERPNCYLFTETSIFGRSNRRRIQQLQALDESDGEDNEPEFSFYFANSMNHVYKWAHLQCGKTDIQENMENQLHELNQLSIKSYLKFEALKDQNYYDQLLEVIVALSHQIFQEIAIEQTACFYLFLNQENRPQ